MPKPKLKKIRLDELLIRRGLADSLHSAAAMIMAGQVLVGEQRIDKPGHLVSEIGDVRIKNDSTFVSRGGDKLMAAIEDLQLKEQFSNKIVLDIGASTGGFTHCVLSLGAAQVVALDVGTAQLAWSLRQDSRVISIEKTDIRDYTAQNEIQFDWVVADVSFTSLSKLIPDIARVAPLAQVLLLVKPQFELPRHLVPDGGIVENEADRQLAMTEVREALVSAHYEVISEIDARVHGRQGNREMFIYARPIGTIV